MSTAFNATRATVLTDADEFFEALLESVSQATRSIDILAWDFHTGVRLIREESGKQRLTVATLLKAAVERNPELNVRVLCWKPPLSFLWKRQYERKARKSIAHPRIHLHYEKFRPIRGCHHQKLIVIDNKVAFCGGFDLSRNRWDSTDHRPIDRRRRNPEGESYHPFHDVQMVVEGEIGNELGNVFRQRWKNATNEHLEPMQLAGPSPWPSLFKPDFVDAPVDVSLTLFKEGVFEVKNCIVEALSSARRNIYIETQYFSSTVLCELLCERLKEPHCPEIVMVVPRRLSNLQEDLVMGPVCARMIGRLQAADAHGRLRCVYPLVGGLGKDFINLHSKVMIVDDRFLRVGSANLSDRSLTLDSECDLSISSDLPSEAVRGIRRRLLGEHLGVSALELSALESRNAGSLIAVVDSQKVNDRRLETLRPRFGWLAPFLKPFADPLMAQRSPSAV